MRPILSVILACLLLPPIAAAQTPAADCRAEITLPAPDSKVGPIESVSGTATIPRGTRLWVLSHRKDLGGVWWPQGNGPAEIVESRWQVGVFFGEPRDVGATFEVVALVVGQDGQQTLQQWVETALRTRQYPPIPMPASAPGCPQRILVVTKVG